MLKYIWPIVIIVTANTVYPLPPNQHADVQPFASLTITYTVAAALSLFYITGSGKGFMGRCKSNWTSIVFGFAVVALEFGSISLYRADGK